MLGNTLVWSRMLLHTRHLPAYDHFDVNGRHSTDGDPPLTLEVVGANTTHGAHYYSRNGTLNERESVEDSVHTVALAGDGGDGLGGGGGDPLKVERFACPVGGCLDAPSPPVEWGNWTNLLRWSELGTWPGGKVPGEGEDLEIPEFTRVLLDVVTPVLGVVEVKGELYLADPAAYEGVDPDVEVITKHVLQELTGRLYLHMSQKSAH